MHYSYDACGLTIASDIELPMLMGSKASSAPDITVKRGDPKASSVSALTQVSAFGFANPDTFQMAIPDLAEFGVVGGSRISYGRGKCPRLLAAVLQSIALPMALMQRGYLVLNGTALARDNAALVLLGATASGKSSVAASLAVQGFSVLSDDICVIDHEGHALALSPCLKLWRQTADQLGLALDDALQVRTELDRHYWMPTTSLAPQHAPVQTYLSLSVTNGDTSSITPVTGFPIFGYLRAGTFQFCAMGAMGREADHLRHCSQLAATARFAKASRPLHPMPIATYAEAIASFSTQVNA